MSNQDKSFGYKIKYKRAMKGWVKNHLELKHFKDNIEEVLEDLKFTTSICNSCSLKCREIIKEKLQINTQPKKEEGR